MSEKKPRKNIAEKFFEATKGHEKLLEGVASTVARELSKKISMIQMEWDGKSTVLTIQLREPKNESSENRKIDEKGTDVGGCSISPPQQS